MLANRLITLVTLTLLLLAHGCGQHETEEARALKREPIPSFTDISDVKEKKQTFFEFLYPMVVLANQEIQQERDILQALIAMPADLTEEEEVWVFDRCLYYKAPCDEDAPSKQAAQLLLNRLGSVPPSLALAQAANESAWGTSRFALDGNNYFGQWCYSDGCGLIPANRNDDASHEVRVFEHPLDSVRSYVHNINTSPAYKPLRNLRLEARNADQPRLGYNLAPGLVRYSERREAYVEEIQHMIRANNLEKYDQRSMADPHQVTSNDNP